MAQAVVGGITSGLSKLNPFGRPKADEDDAGDTIEPDSVGGGGRASKKAQVNKHELRISHALKSFLVHEKVLSEADAGLDSDQPTTGLEELLRKPHIIVSSSITDRSYALSEYFISSSHNTYLLAHQLYGSASTDAYETALTTGSRCVEIDAWDNEDDEEEPKVTHGYTLASHIPFRKVCEAMHDVVDQEAAQPSEESQYKAAPIMLSLENHCSAQGQLRLVQIMKEVWGDRLVSKRVRDQGTEAQEGTARPVRLEQLSSKIAVIVEYHFPEGPGPDEEEEVEEVEGEDEEAKKERKAYEQKKKEAPKEGIIPELAELGVYAQSVKPRDNSWFEGELKGGPHDHLVNVSESGLSSLMPKSSHQVGMHNSKHLMRVYPKGTRISSQNLNPVPFWGVGAQICALNWQTFDASMQLNEALFSGTDGYVLKPEGLRSGGDGKAGSGSKRKLRLRVAGATDVPLPEGRKASEIHPYVTCTLVHPADHEKAPPKRKTAAYKQHKLGIIHKGEQPPPTDPVWDETLEWEYEDNELTFLRILIKSDDSFARNPMFGVASVRLLYVVDEWTFIRLLDLKGRETRCTLLVKFEFEEA